ncbi:hypothetical protein PR048_012603 [Dryococelus australis]|uniref:Uncharacterized protein n=1 Tax=Dryococelus australis TaxID=614101 RepID=A0ABQ9HPX4_9NEOP|nr:hypothetical protein PR048_012603 [Dryococelus australis]
MKQYKRSDRFDHFWKSVLRNSDSSKVLVAFIQKVLIFSHGNAFVERVFSISKEIIVDNQLARSLIAQHQVNDGVQALEMPNHCILRHLKIKRKMMRKRAKRLGEKKIAQTCEGVKGEENENSTRKVAGD